ncbi:collagen alpha-2(XI) chain-like [Oncorhynchus mykiss]|uniref:collagen alpha-2(XI) chain-like n=1 Tax=Oncorhynchus mykiss TaxID=8022 RepID=UPI001878C022|nr:collagen alpha-2(XI) chain-like [Oncorhynchus mykiss]
MTRRTLDSFPDHHSSSSFSWPQGTKDSPATTCNKLGLIHPHLQDGNVYVTLTRAACLMPCKCTCNFTVGGMTCIPPVLSQVEVRVWGSTEIHRGDLELLPLRDVSAEGRGDH